MEVWKSGCMDVRTRDGLGMYVWIRDVSLEVWTRDGWMEVWKSGLGMSVRMYGCMYVWIRDGCMSGLGMD